MRAIMTGKYVPGERLSPARIAEEYGVSHIPVREALAALEAAGHVRRVPRVGAFVAELSSELIEDVYHWRQMIEEEAHRLAMPKLTGDDIERMRQLNDNSYQAAETRSGRFLDFNRAFHFVAFERVGSPMMLRFLNQLWDAAARYQNTMTYVSMSRTILRDQHMGIVEAFEAKDVELVNARMAEHRWVTLTAIRGMISGEEAEA